MPSLKNPELRSCGPLYFQLERDFQLEIKKFPHIVKQGNYHFYNWKSSHKVSMVTILQVSMETILQVSMETLY